jgi:hypothetical protein
LVSVQLIATLIHIEGSKVLKRTSLSAAAVGLAVLSPLAQARGVSPYLPLNMSPHMERQIERVLILADQPILSRPIPAATVLDALPAACRIDRVLCSQVRRYLNRYMRRLNVDHAGIEGASGDESRPIPNSYGTPNDSAWRASLGAHWQVHDHVILSVGAVAHEDEVNPTGSMLSVGFDFAQLDVGYRPHWYSPFTDSAMLISTEAQTLPSITLSNYRPLTSLGVTYEVFLAKMEYSDRIAFGTSCDPTRPAQPDETCTAGRPRLGGMRIGIQPTPGWSLSANRLLQYGGGKREGSYTQFLRALWQPREYDNRSETLGQDQEFGNQLASFTSRFIFPGSTPFAAYLEYAGEDTSYEGNYRLGNSALSIGLHFPRLWRHFDLAIEVSEWQNVWYVNGLYGDGLTDNGLVLGHWGADQRIFGDDIGAQTAMARLGWEPRFGGLFQVRARTVENESYGLNDYERGYDVSVSYARTLAGFTAGAEFTAGRDTLGNDFSRLAGFVRFGDEWNDGGTTGDWESGTARPSGAELFVDAGVAASEVTIRLGDGSRKQTTSMETSPHIGIGARRSVSAHSDLGVRAEIDRVDDHMLLAVRAVDYRYRFRSPLALTAFLGAARYDLATPAYGYYFGAGAQWRDILPGFDLSLDLRYADKVARDRFERIDPDTSPLPDLRPDSFYDITSGTLSISYRW